MDKKSNPVTLYTMQQDIVLQTLAQAGVYHVKWAFIQQKYQEVAPVFLHAYRWFASQAAQMVPKPPQADSAIWAFPDPGELDSSGGGHPLTLSVPADQVIFFDRMEWEAILNFRFLGTPEKTDAYKKQLVRQGVKQASDVVLTAFYPLLRRELEASWRELFRHNEAARLGAPVPVQHLQAGLWELRREWVVAIDGAPVSLT